MRAPIRTKPTPSWLTCGPLRGVRDSTGPATPSTELAYRATNMYPQPGPHGSGLRSRPGFSKCGDDIGSVFQGICQWTMDDGTRMTAAVAGGTIWRYDWSNEEWLEAVDSADLATASVTLSNSARRVSMTPFSGEMIISDGVNAVVAWDGTSGSGGVRQVTGAGPFYGPLTVYYGKLFGIFAADKGAGARKTMGWSEENDVDNGWMNAPYSNAWQNPGGHNDRLVALEGTNDALYVFRETRCRYITGAVASDFTTSGTLENLSDTVGTVSPWAVMAVPQGVLFIDNTAALHLVRAGAMEPVDLWADSRETTRYVPRGSLEWACSLRDDATESVLVGLPEEGTGNDLGYWMVFSDRDFTYSGAWRWGSTVSEGACTFGAEVLDAQGLGRWMHASGDATFVHGTERDGPWSDEGNAIMSGLVTPLQGYDFSDELRADMIEVSVPSSTATEITLSYSTSRGGSGVTHTLALPVNIGGFILDVSYLDIDSLSDPIGVNRKASARVFGRGRGIQVTLGHSKVGEYIVIDMVRVRAFLHSGNNKGP